ncbi:hypothetical protein SAMN05444397_10257 [Flavobacterium aquidurense]|uniref:LysM domain-containing protein n=1 Tax=Flavobacterium frigidimaris TaxID=262320 RepID=A0ABX4BTJ4_FLAFR|nr:hypothetical protein [Flavobacterium frigidimaris]OXA80302.1 hypothetical protein B0A65_06615 [Flavobacterium frigidimaris]SDY71737.1 hypothetical protein SAMN05444397_10257 [Flavobacterium aquidurense]
MLKKLIAFALLSILFYSCHEEPSLQNSSTSLKNSKSGTVINGRFYFSSREDLKKNIEELKKESLVNLETKFEQIYAEGFISNSPIVNIENQKLILQLSQKKDKKTMKSSSFVVEAPEDPQTPEGPAVPVDEIKESIIADPYFAAIVNQNNEVMVGDSIYKIVEDLGVLAVHKSDTLLLYNYLENMPPVQNLLTPCELRLQQGGYTRIAPGISRYIVPADMDCGNGGQSNIPKTPVVAVQQLSQDQILQNQIDNLPICDGNRDTSWFQSLFGTNKSCINYFDSRHRIKTEFWNQSWGVYSSIGVQTRVQVKTAGIWWASDADELYLGINKVYLKYNYPDPKINTNNPFSSDPLPPLYMYNNEYKLLADDGNFRLVNISPGTNLPFFGFGSDNPLNIYIRQLPKPNYQINSESNIKELYKLGIKFLKSTFNSGAKNEFIITYQKNATEIEVVYFGEKYKKINDNQIQRKFDSQIFEFLVGVSYGSYTAPTLDNPTGAPKPSYSFKIEKGGTFRNYTYHELDIYALGRRGGTWSGTRMITN